MRPPTAFQEKMQSLLGGEYGAFRAALDRPPLQGLRCNRLKLMPETLAGLLPFPLSPINWCVDGFLFPSEARPAKSPLYHAGLFYIQEPSAMSSAAFLAVSPNSRVLDLCAAPGGKSLQAAGKLDAQRGLLVANDISASRCKALVKNIEMGGVTNAVVLNDTPKKLAARFGVYFDRILIDAPCSGEGMFRKDASAAQSWTVHKPEACLPAQRELLHYAAQMLQPGGRIAYSTCTFSPAENEAMIFAFLQKHPEFSVYPLDHAGLGVSEGQPAWGGGCEALRGAARLWPHKHTGEGHFVCVLEKATENGERIWEPSVDNAMPVKAGAKRAHYRAKRRMTEVPCVPRTEMALFEKFCDENLNTALTGHFVLHGQSLYRIPAGLPDLSGIRTIRSGWYLGECKNNRFEPSQALAMGLRKTDARYVLDYALDDTCVMQYLQGASFVPDTAHSPEAALWQADKPWVLICVAGYPLGWGRVTGGVIKNKYPQGWLLS